MNALKIFNMLTRRMTVEEIQNLTDEEIVSMETEIPDRPGQHGFLLDPAYFKSKEQMAEILYALTKRLHKVKLN